MPTADELLTPVKGARARIDYQGRTVFAARQHESMHHPGLLNLDGDSHQNHKHDTTAPGLTGERSTMHDSTHAFRLAERVFFNGKIGTRVASCNPFVSLYWLVSGRNVNGTAMYAQKDGLDRMEALRRYTVGRAWFSGDEKMHKGTLATRMLRDFAVLSGDYFAIDEDEIRHLESMMTVVNGRIVFWGRRIRAACASALAGKSVVVTGR
jgi:hypothetical protein